MAALEIVLVPALSDNYVYLAHDADTGETAVVDPAESDPVIAALEARGWKLTCILNTHHHHDHIGGNEALKAKYGCPITGPRSEAGRIPNMDEMVGEGDSISFSGHSAKVFEVPGHTSGHIAFWFESNDVLFSGDTLFALGCGRMFEGTAEQMWSSLAKLRDLPDATRIYCGHEYTQSNARFALSVDGGNADLKSQSAAYDALRAKGQPTIPTTLGADRLANPFLRADDPTLAAAVGLAGADPVAVFAEVRKRKDNF
jgi:hydroxyacylglutathione hydrolase